MNATILLRETVAGALKTVKASPEDRRDAERHTDCFPHAAKAPEALPGAVPLLLPGHNIEEEAASSEISEEVLDGHARSPSNCL